jgi:hypothetical protein
MGKTAEVGFEAAYIFNNGAAEQNSTGNALVGAYLNRIGLPDRAIVYITQAAPQSMAWLNLEDAKNEGIDVSLFTPNGATQTPNSPSQSSGSRSQAPSPAATQIAVAASFDCRKARFADEMTVCQDSRLAKMDLNLSHLYNGLRSIATPRERRQLDSEQLSWIRQGRPVARTLSASQLSTKDACDISTEMSLPFAMGRK